MEDLAHIFPFLNGELFDLRKIYVHTEFKNWSSEKNALCTLESGINIALLLLKYMYKVEMGLRLFFFPNFAGAMFIQGATFIPDSRVGEFAS